MALAQADAICLASCLKDRYRYATRCLPADMVFQNVAVVSYATVAAMDQWEAGENHVGPD